jgi:hypothetical protein
MLKDIKMYNHHYIKKKKKFKKFKKKTFHTTAAILPMIKQLHMDHKHPNFIKTFRFF